jgi:hypothetical protein
MEDYEICGMKFSEIFSFLHFFRRSEKVEGNARIETQTLFRGRGFGKPARRSLAQDAWTLATAEPSHRRRRACHAEAFSVGGLDVNSLK